MKIDEFVNELKKCNIYLSDEQLEKFEKYAEFLIEYNKTTNLTAIKDKESIYLKHFYDSLLVCHNEALRFDDVESIIDIGSGAGFPGMALKILYPHLKLTLLDSNNKKTKFLEKLANLLDFNDVLVVNDRAENFVKNNRHKYDVSIARAVSDLRIISELCLPFTKVGGYFIAQKGHYEDELKNASNTIKKLNAEVLCVSEFELPFEKSFRANIFIRLNKEIESKYPRSYDQIIKKELK